FRPRTGADYELGALEDFVSANDLNTVLVEIERGNGSVVDYRCTVFFGHVNHKRHGLRRIEDTGVLLKDSYRLRIYSKLRVSCLNLFSIKLLMVYSNRFHAGDALLEDWMTG